MLVFSPWTLQEASSVITQSTITKKNSFHPVKSDSLYGSISLKFSDSLSGKAINIWQIPKIYLKVHSHLIWIYMPVTHSGCGHCYNKWWHPAGLYIFIFKALFFLFSLYIYIKILRRGCVTVHAYCWSTSKSNGGNARIEITVKLQIEGKRTIITISGLGVYSLILV